MQMDQTPFFQAFGESVTVGIQTVTAIVQQQQDDNSSGYGHIEQATWLQVLPADASHFVEDATVVVRGNTFKVYKAPYANLEGIMEVELGFD